jgi:hydrogenase nickel incorporation protein HypB
MCTVCGCSTHEAVAHEAPARVEPAKAASADLHYGRGAVRASVPGLSDTRLVQIETDVLSANQRHADSNRAHFAAHRVAAFNLVSSPGAGKTTLLCATLRALRERLPALPLAVIEGDQQTAHDAERIRACGVQALQINTGQGCHLDARMVGEAFERLPLHGAAEPALLFIENVGNLVCPALWDLGERAKIVVLSVTEGDDKPLKYPDMFAAAQLMVIHKLDLLPHVDFDIARCIDFARRVNPDIETLLVSSRSGQGFEAWLDWLGDALGLAMPTRPETLNEPTAPEATLRQRIAELEARLLAAGLTP